MFAVIYIHNFSLQSVLRHEPELIPKPVVLTDPALTKPCVVQLTPAARASGICQGMSPSQAMARCGNLVVKTRSLPQEQTAMETLMQTAYAFSPHIEATAPGVCTIELKGLAIQTNETSAKQWATEILRVLKQFHLVGQIGFAETPALALLAAHAARPVLVAQNEKGRARCLHRAAQDETDFTSTLSIEALDLPFESLEILKRWGINTAGAFLALGKDRLAERLGPAIVEVFDRLSTQSVRPLKIATPPEAFAEEIEFENEIETLEPLLFILRRFVEQLSRRIELLYLVVAELHLKLGLTSGATYERAFTIPSPTGNAETLFRVLHTHLETLRTDAPIATLRLAVKPGRSESHQFGLFETTLRNPNQFAETLARLTALCGSDRVGTPVIEATYRPDTFQMKAPDFTIPKGLRPPAQGCEERATLGLEHRDVHNPERVAPSARRPRVHRELQRSRNAHWDREPDRERGRGRNAVHRKQFPRGLPLRRFRPPLPACIETREHRPVLIRSGVFNGVIADVRGPFLSSGNWWENNRWWREEWDIQTSDGNLYRIFRPAEEVGAVGRASPRAVQIAKGSSHARLAGALASPTTTAVKTSEHDIPPESGRGQPHSRTLREAGEPQNLRQVLECGSPMPLLPKTDEDAQNAQSHPLAPAPLQYFVEGIYD